MKVPGGKKASLFDTEHSIDSTLYNFTIRLMVF